MAMSPSQLHQDLSCSVCLDVFNDPVMLSCGHSFCRTCLHDCWTQNPERECLLCKQRSSKLNPPLNLALRNACESYLQQNRKGSLQTHLQTLEKKLQTFKSVKDNSDKVAAHIKSQFLYAEKQIKAEFEKLHQFLRTEEEGRISDLRKEEEEKMSRINEDLDRQIKEISLKIKESEEILKDDVRYKQGFTRTVQSAQVTVPNPQPDSGALIDVAKHLGNLRFKVWNRMKDICPYYPVVLDLNTANISLQISADLSTVSFSDENPELPDNPERMSACEGVLGSEGFSSGTRGWVVEVGDSEDWAIGVAQESASRKERILAVPENGFYCIWKLDSKIVAGLSDPDDKIISPPTVRRVCVTYNRGKGQVTFSNYDTKATLHTFTSTFKKKIYPYFYNKSKNALRVLPLQTMTTAKI